MGKASRNISREGVRGDTSFEEGKHLRGFNASRIIVCPECLKYRRSLRSSGLEGISIGNFTGRSLAAREYGIPHYRRKDKPTDVQSLAGVHNTSMRKLSQSNVTASQWKALKNENDLEKSMCRRKGSQNTEQKPNKTSLRHKMSSRRYTTTESYKQRENSIHNSTHYPPRTKTTKTTGKNSRILQAKGYQLYKSYSKKFKNTNNLYQAVSKNGPPLRYNLN